MQRVLGPEAVFVNSLVDGQTGACWYESFEYGANQLMWFTGRKSKLIDNTSSVSRPSRVSVSGQITDGVIVRAWIRRDAQSAAKIIPNLAIEGVTVTSDNVVATLDDWNLVEVVCPASAAEDVTFQPSNGLVVWVDDLIVHGKKTITQATVRDDEHRVIVGFGPDHFPTRKIFSARGDLAYTGQDGATGHLSSMTVTDNTPGRMRTADFIVGGAQNMPTGTMILPMINLPDFFDSLGVSRVIDNVNNVSKAISPKGLNARGSVLDVKASPDRIQTSSDLTPALDLLRGIRPNANTVNVDSVGSTRPPVPVRIDSVKSGQKP